MLVAVGCNKSAPQQSANQNSQTEQQQTVQDNSSQNQAQPNITTQPNSSSPTTTQTPPPTKQATPTPTPSAAKVGASGISDTEIPARDNQMVFRDLKITSPNTEMNWVKGSNYQVTWKTINLLSTAKIKITLSSFSQMTTNSGQYTLQVPSNLPSGAYLLKVYEIKDDGSEGVGGTSNDYIIIK